MKSLIILFLGISSLNASLFKQVPDGMQETVLKLTSFPATQNLLEKLEKEEGGIDLKWVQLQSAYFTAFWAGDRRIIGLNSKKKWNEGEKLYSILFEIHNAQSEKVLRELDGLARDKKISKEDYVYKVEEVEYQNAQKTTALIKEGIHKGYFPRDTQFPVYPPFHEHLRMQKETGHSGLIAKMYDRLTLNCQK